MNHSQWTSANAIAMFDVFIESMAIFLVNILLTGCIVYFMIKWDDKRRK
jgi:hypothetical protein